MPAQDLHIGSLEIEANGRVLGQSIIKVIDGLFEHFGTANLFDEFWFVNFVATVEDTDVAGDGSGICGGYGRHFA